jgi:hypothetical protein
MMHGCGKSDFAIVAEKPANKAEQSAAESVEPRAETKGNANQQSCWRQRAKAKHGEPPLWFLRRHWRFPQACTHR